MCGDAQAGRLARSGGAGDRPCTERHLASGARLVQRSSVGGPRLWHKGDGDEVPRVGMAAATWFPGAAARKETLKPGVLG